jgi:hypothetical protein
LSLRASCPQTQKTFYLQKEITSGISHNLYLVFVEQAFQACFCQIKKFLTYMRDALTTKSKYTFQFLFLKLYKDDVKDHQKIMAFVVCRPWCHIKSRLKTHKKILVGVVEGRGKRRVWVERI